MELPEAEVCGDPSCRSLEFFRLGLEVAGETGAVNEALVELVLLRFHLDFAPGAF
jgi:hypothetical protein